MNRFLLHILYVMMCSIRFASPHKLENLTKAARGLTDVLIHKNSRFIPPYTKYPGLVKLTTRVVINVELRNLIDFDFSRGTLKLYGIFSWQWKDETLKWDMHEFYSIQRIQLPKNRIWFPSVYITNTAEGTNTISVAESVTVNSEGEVTYQTPQIIDVLCSPDVYKYPYDVHICAIQLAPVLEYHQVELTIIDKNRLFANFWENTEWNVSAVNITTKDFTYVNIYIKITRHPFFLMINLVAPVLILAVMNMFVFALPHESGERISFSLTMLLSFVVFISFTFEALPESSSSVCVFNIFLSIELVQSTLIALSVIMVSWLYHKTEADKVPKFLSFIACRRGQTKQLLCIACQQSQTNQSVVRPVDANADSTDAIDEGKEDENTITWQKMATVVDKYCFILFASISFIEKCIVFGIILS